MHKLQQSHECKASKDRYKESQSAESVLANIAGVCKLCRYELIATNKDESTCNGTLSSVSLD